MLGQCGAVQSATTSTLPLRRGVFVVRSSWWVVPAPSVARSTTTARESVSDVMQSLQLMMVSQSYTTLLYLTMHTCMYNVNESLYILCVFVRFIRWGFLVILPLVCYTHTCNMYMYLHCRLSMYKVHVHVHVEYSTCTCRVQYMCICFCVRTQSSNVGLW